MSQLAVAPAFQSHRKTLVVLLLLAFVGWLILCGHAHAGEAGTGLEWETPFQAFYRSITGPIAFGVAFLGICVCGMVLIWGGEINEFVRRMVMVILVVAVIMFAGNLLRRMFAGGAATITPVAAQVVVNPPSAHGFPQ